MPIYEYECQECGCHHEMLQKVSDNPLTTCPSCDTGALKKLVSAAGFRLSGSGWYETDFKSDNQKNLAKGDTEKSKDNKKDNKKDKKTDANKKSSTKSSAVSNETKKSPTNVSS